MDNLKRLSLLLFVSLFLVQVSEAQQLFVSGSLNLTSSSSEQTVGGTTDEGPTTSTFGLNPKVGYYVSEDLAIGAGIGFNRNKTTTPGNPETVRTGSNFYLNPFARYYLLNEGRFGVFGEGGLTFGFGSSEVSSGGTTNEGPSVSTFEIYAAPAIEFALTDMVALEARIGSLAFETEKEETDLGGGTTSTDKSSSFGLRLFPNSFNFGIRVSL
ncbi:MAG: outer membrane beta-barrel protein [Balneolaceae bacterium]